MKILICERNKTCVYNLYQVLNLKYFKQNHNITANNLAAFKSDMVSFKGKGVGMQTKAEMVKAEDLFKSVKIPAEKTENGLLSIKWFANQCRSNNGDMPIEVGFAKRKMSFEDVLKCVFIL